MVTLTVKAKDESLFDYLQFESSKDEKGNFIFSSTSRASEVISRFVLKKLMEEMMKVVSPNEKKKELLTYVSNDKLLYVLKEIENMLNAYFENNEEFNLEGFMIFRLKKQSNILKEELEVARDLYYDDGTSNWVYLKNIMDGQPSVEEELKIIVEQNSKIKLIGKKKKYLEEQISRFDYKAEDDIISHIVLMSPKKLKVYDPNHQLSKETVVILKKLFDEKVLFLREVYITTH